MTTPVTKADPEAALPATELGVAGVLTRLRLETGKLELFSLSLLIGSVATSYTKGPTYVLTESFPFFAIYPYH